MARVLTPQDAYSIMNLLVAQATGQDTQSVVDSSSFVSAGETVLATGMENVINSLSIVLNRTIIASRPYNAKLALIQSENDSVYSTRLRKISFYSRKALPSGAFNTDLFTNLADGFTNGQNPDANGDAQSTKSMWEQNQPMALELNFGGCSTWQDCITMYEEQIQTAFRNEAEFARFVSGYLTEHQNDIELQKEAWNRMALLNKIASTYSYDLAGVTTGSVINLTKAYNDKFGTSYTSEELRSTYLKEFLAFFVSEFKLASKFMAEKTANYHWPVPKTVNGIEYEILRHTPYDRQRVFLYSPLFTEAEALVLPEIFRPEYLDLETQYEEVTFWQSIDDRASINVTPAIIETDTTDSAYGTQVKGSAVELDYVVGMIMDTDALVTSFNLDRVATTPLEARKLYRNTWNTFLKNIIDDPTENCVLFIMADESDDEGEGD